MKKLINLALIKSLNPCQDRLDNFIKHYGTEDGFPAAKFMRLKKITHQDKMWVTSRLLSPTNALKYVGAMACTTLHIYEQMYPNDLRPRKAAEMARDAGKVDSETLQAAYDAAYAAARDAHTAVIAYGSTANASAHAYAAANAAYAAAHYTTDTAYINYLAAYDNYISTYVAVSQAKQEKLNRTIMVKFLKKEGFV